jgi:uncharacterized protein (DUF2236 family)
MEVMILDGHFGYHRSMAMILPDAEEAARLAPGPRSVVWRIGSDARVMSAAGAPLLLQVAHPTVAGGVRDHSDFKKDPWGRLWRTLDYVYLLTYGGPQTAANIGRQLREMHKPIKGTKPDGERYHALEPEAYAWVHATLAEVLVKGYSKFCRPLTPHEVERLWQEWLDMGRLLGVREHDLPDTWGGFDDYMEEMIATRLEDNDVVQDVLSTLSEPKAPPLPRLDDRVWKLLRVPASQSARLGMVGMLRPSAREKLGLKWTKKDQRMLDAMALASRAATPLLPESIRRSGPAYLERRGRAIERGPFARAA